MIPHLADKFTCTGCLACVDACERKAISNLIGSDGHIYVKYDGKKCVECHRCETVCSIVNGLSYSSNNIKQSYAYAAYCTDVNLYENSTSGGVFVALATRFISEGGIYVV